MKFVPKYKITTASSQLPFSEGQIKEEKSSSSSPVNLKYGSPAKPDASDTAVTETTQGKTSGGSTSSSTVTAMEEPLSIKIEEKVSRKRRASDDSLDVSFVLFHVNSYTLYWHHSLI